MKLVNFDLSKWKLGAEARTRDGRRIQGLLFQAGVSSTSVLEGWVDGVRKQWSEAGTVAGEESSPQQDLALVEQESQYSLQSVSKQQPAVSLYEHVQNIEFAASRLVDISASIDFFLQSGPIEAGASGGLGGGRAPAQVKPPQSPQGTLITAQEKLESAYLSLHHVAFLLGIPGAADSPIDHLNQFRIQSR